MLCNLSQRTVNLANRKMSANMDALITQAALVRCSHGTYRHRCRNGHRRLDRLHSSQRTPRYVRGCGSDMLTHWFHTWRGIGLRFPISNAAGRGVSQIASTEARIHPTNRRQPVLNVPGKDRLCWRWILLHALQPNLLQDMRSSSTVQSMRAPHRRRDC